MPGAEAPSLDFDSSRDLLYVAAVTDSGLEIAALDSDLVIVNGPILLAGANLDANPILRVATDGSVYIVALRDIWKYTPGLEVFAWRTTAPFSIVVAADTDPDGSLLVATTADEGGTSNEIAWARITPSGATELQVDIPTETPGTPVPLSMGTLDDIASDGLGNVYVVGTGDNGDFSARGKLLKFERDGSLLWFLNHDYSLGHNRVVTNGCGVTVAGALETLQPPFLYSAQYGSQSAAANTIRWAQGEAPWGDDLYDHCDFNTKPCGGSNNPHTVRHQTIASRGCALTALATALHYVGVHELPGPNGIGTVPLHPGSLNTSLAAHRSFTGQFDGFGVGHSVTFRHAVGIINGMVTSLTGRPSRLVFRDSGIQNSSPATVQQLLCEGDKGLPVPVILQVARTPKTDFHHYVVAVASRPDGTFDVMDPIDGNLHVLDPRTTVTNPIGEYSKWRIRGLVQDPEEDLSALIVSIQGDAEILITDPQGHRTGYDGTQEGLLEDIPNSSNSSDVISDPEDPNDIADPVVKSATVETPQKRTYRLQVIGTAGGPYALNVNSVDRDGYAQDSISFDGAVAPGAIDSFDIETDPLPGAALRVNPVSTPLIINAWLGLTNSHDHGASFDLRAELYKNGKLLGAAETRCVRGLSRDADQAKKVTAAFPSNVDPTPIAGDLIALRLLARLGTNADDTNCSSESRTTGIRLYYDGSNVASGFGSPSGVMFFLDSSYHLNVLSGTAPGMTAARHRNSPALTYAHGNPWRVLGTWSRVQPWTR